ncbi:hypothetical protein POJ06DRAFT_267040 [Lipomyces tetrasporus]|uniref:Transcription factor IWS1 n=1 Tax=Lipomyces tetrasporus TaxID=54092 RepID=A0AAD7VU66_9ASCO|nr:uncharacterized protein POJ06DRAFT_267040 [Lipomyces tetrasporus]KAJ8100870.1 hypothetical protein POJ06DRAFT_267040 [Lipomyces tetrasporus]
MSDIDSPTAPAQDEEKQNGLEDIFDNDDELSELDEDQFKDVEVDAIGLPITEEVYKIQRHKRVKEAGESGGTRTKERTRSRRRGDTDGGIIEGEGVTGRRKKDRKERVENELDRLDPDQRRLRELEERVDAALKTQKKRKKVDEDDIEQMQDDRIVEVRERMRQAAIKDAEAIKDGVPATHKLQMLPEVRDVLQKHSLYDSILDNNLLESVRLWLEPLPDASLPAYSIQRELFVALEELPIKTVHLRESGIGRVVLFYQKSRKPQLGIKRIADKLVGDWSRPIMGRNKKGRNPMAMRLQA